MKENPALNRIPGSALGKLEARAEEKQIKRNQKAGRGDQKWKYAKEPLAPPAPPPTSREAMGNSLRRRRKAREITGGNPYGYSG